MTTSSNAETKTCESLDLEALRNAPEAIALLDTRGKVVLWNPEAEKLFGFGEPDVLKKRCSDCVDAEGVPLCLTHCPAVAALHDGQPRDSVVFRRDAEGKLLPLWLKVEPYFDEEGNIAHVQETFTLHRILLHQPERLDGINKKMLLDNLTGLPNRKATRICLEQRLENLPNNPTGFGVIILIVEQLEQIGEEHGLEAENQVLKEVSAVMRSQFRATDTISRWGMNHLIAMVTVNDEELLARIGERVAGQLRQINCPFLGEGEGLEVHVGSAVAGENDNALSLVARAEEHLPNDSQG